MDVPAPDGGGTAFTQKMEVREVEDTSRWESLTEGAFGDPAPKTGPHRDRYRWDDFEPAADSSLLQIQMTLRGAMQENLYLAKIKVSDDPNALEKCAALCEAGQSGGPTAGGPWHNSGRQCGAFRVKYRGGVECQILATPVRPLVSASQTWKEARWFEEFTCRNEERCDYGFEMVYRPFRTVVPAATADTSETASSGALETIHSLTGRENAANCRILCEAWAAQRGSTCGGYAILNLNQPDMDGYAQGSQLVCGMHATPVPAATWGQEGERKSYHDITSPCAVEKSGCLLSGCTSFFSLRSFLCCSFSSQRSFLCCSFCACQGIFCNSLARSLRVLPVELTCAHQRAP